MSGAPIPEVDLTFDAVTLARGWLSVAVAAGDDPERPALWRTVHIEIADDGIRVVATDSYILLTTWVPALTSLAPPDIPVDDVSPNDTVTVMDTDWRGRDLLRFAWRSATAKDAPVMAVRLTTGLAEPDDGQLAGFEAPCATLAFPAGDAVADQVTMRAAELEYPDWRPIVEGEAARISSAVFDPALLGRLCSVSRWWKGAPMQITHTHGRKAFARMVGADGHVLRGAIMGTASAVFEEDGR